MKSCRLHCFDVVGSRAANKVRPTAQTAQLSDRRLPPRDGSVSTESRHSKFGKEVYIQSSMAERAVFIRGGVKKKVRNSHLMFMTP